MRNLSLKKLQQQFSHLARFGATTEELNALQFYSTKRFDEKTRFGVYHYAINARMMDAVIEDYPMLEKVVGKKSFRDFVKDYVTSRPSHYSSLSELSEGLPSYVQSKSKARGKGAAYLSDLARFEWEKNLVEYAPEQDQKFQDVRDLNLDLLLDAVLILDSSVRLIETNWSVHKKRIVRKKNRIMLCLHDHEVLAEDLSAEYFKFLKSLKSGLSVRCALEAFKKNIPSQKDFSNKIARWIELGVIIGFKKGGVIE